MICYSEDVYNFLPNSVSCPYFFFLNGELLLKTSKMGGCRWDVSQQNDTGGVVVVVQFSCLGFSRWYDYSECLTCSVLAGWLFGGYMVGVLCSSSVVALILDCHRRRSSSLQIPNNKWVVVPPSYHKCMYKQSKRRLNRQMYACFQRIHHHHSRRRRDRNGNKVHFMTAITTSVSIISTKNNISSSNSNNSDIDGSGIKKWSMGWFVGRTDEQLDWSSSGGGYDDDDVSSLSK